jgi:hypothetical protein
MPGETITSITAVLLPFMTYLMTLPHNSYVRIDVLKKVSIHSTVFPVVIPRS